MNDRPTPETDAMRHFLEIHGWNPNHHEPVKTILSVVGRLERERDEARQHAEYLQTTINIDRQVDAGHAMYRGGLLSKVDSLEKQLASERVLADRLADIAQLVVADAESPSGHFWPFVLTKCREVLNAWKEARK